MSDSVKPTPFAASLTRRSFVGAAAAASVAAVTRAQGVRSETRPNFLFLMADDMGYADLSCYGRRDYTTPHLDRLAGEGVKLTHAYANSPVCTASRTALVTGRYQYRTDVGLYEPLAGENVGLPAGHPTMASTLKKSGYGTALVGKWHVGNVPQYGPLKYGYDHFWGFGGGALDYFTHKVGEPDSALGLWDGEITKDEHGYLTDLIADKSIGLMRDYTKAKTPFLLSVHFNAPHWPWEGPEDEALAKQGGLSSYQAGNLATYGAMVRRMDVAIGRIVQEVERLGIGRNTVVVFTSDNGGERFSDTWPFTGKKTELLEGGLRVPAIVRWPGHIRAGSTSTQVCMNMDWMPTFVSLAGGQIDPAFPTDGMDLSAVLTGKSAPVSRKVFWRYRANAQRAMRDGDMKWLKINDNQFLFNVVADPLERANLRYKQPEVFNRMVEEFDRWNDTMLPENRVKTSYSFRPAQMADHYNPIGVPAAAATGPENAE